MKPATNKISWMIVGKAVGAISSVGLAALITRHLGLSIYGQFAVGLTLANFLSILAAWGGAQTFISHRVDGAGVEEAWSLLAFTGVVCLLLAPVAIALALIFNLKDVLPVILCFVPLAILVSKAGVLIYHGRQIWNSVVDDVLKSIVPLILIAILVVNVSDFQPGSELLHEGNRTFALSCVFLLALIGVGAIGFASVWSGQLRGLDIAHVRVSLSARSVGRYFTPGVALTASSVVMLGISQVDRLVLHGLVQPELVGVYVLAQTAVNIYSYASQSVVNTIVPELAASTRHRDAQRAYVVCRRYSGLLLVCSFGATCASLVVGHVYFQLFDIGSDFIRIGVSSLTILLAGQFVGSFFGFGITMGSYDENKEPLVISLLISFALVLGLCFLLVPAIGVTGAAVATAVGTIVSKALMWAHFRCCGLRVGII